MSTVFLGRKTGPGRYAQTAAIKVIHPHLAQNRELTEMFLDEARLASCVNHPNVCRVLDFGEAEGTFFLAMEYVRGESFAQVMAAFEESAEARERRILLFTHVLAQACEGLHAIHEAVDSDGRPLRIVHRDVSPQNLLIAYDGSVRLLDFGIASAEGRAHTGSTDVVRGRYAYMAPEQMRGLDLDRRADVWSLGVMLREAISGQNPFLRPTQIATMLAVTQEGPPSWPARVEPRLRAIAELALQRAPEDRFSSARELGDALTRYLSERAESGLSTSLSEHMRKLFAAQIAEKRALLRMISGDDTYTDTFSSGYPAVSVSVTPARNVQTAVEAPRSAPGRRPRASFLAAACTLFVLCVAGSWYATRDDSGVGARGAPESPTAGTLSDAAKPPARELAAASQVLVEALAMPVSDPSTRGDVEPTAQAEPPPTALSGKAERDESSEKRTTPVARKVVRSPAALTGSGTLLIGTSQGWATVFDRGKKLGTTPLRAKLSAGPHTLVIRPYGEGAARRVSFDLPAGETVKLRIEL